MFHWGIKERLYFPILSWNIFFIWIQKDFFFSVSRKYSLWSSLEISQVLLFFHLQIILSSSFRYINFTFLVNANMLLTCTCWPGVLCLLRLVLPAVLHMELWHPHVAIGEVFPALLPSWALVFQVALCGSWWGSRWSDTRLDQWRITQSGSPGELWEKKRWALPLGTWRSQSRRPLGRCGLLPALRKVNVWHWRT